MSKISENDLINKIADFINFTNNKDVIKASEKKKEIVKDLESNPSYIPKMIELQTKANELAKTKKGTNQAKFNRETVIKMKAKILTNNFDSLINPTLLLGNTNSNLNLESQLKNTIIPNDIMVGINNEANDRAIISILRKIKVPDNTNIEQLNNTVSQLTTEINNLNKAVTVSKAQRQSIAKIVKGKQIDISNNKIKINDYNTKLNSYNKIILPLLPKINEYITKTFGTYFIGDKKDELIKRSNSQEIIQEFYEDVMPSSHIGVM